MTYYERNLPHWHPEARSIFLTWRLYGSLPQSALRSLHRLHSAPSKQFLVADQQLDYAVSGPRWLADERVAAVVEAALFRGAGLGQYALHAWVIMPNHVHVLLDPCVAMRRITNGIKGVSAREANSVLHRGGRPFWQDESFDHWVRNATQFERVRLYIENNPVKARLAQLPADWPWSSAFRSTATKLSLPNTSSITQRTR